ncbi:uncharacterized protein LOC108914952 [Anoplophora glabripennis]|uniref:uncharacterized protein LOC108914952 n=1 Tax=Anoplophora glabripennis TaxID=217634 RepID=UPI000874CC85|nr:uncharacterized protein LOC108914952 [Anoplophora glabripennis]
MNRNVPAAVIDTMISSISEATIKQYNTTYRLWWDFCVVNNIPVFQATNNDVLTFLQYVSERHNYRYGALNAHRSALSLILPNNLGTDPMVKRYMKGLSRLKPPRPRYTNTWDPQTVLSYLESLPRDLNLLQSSQKLSTLLALITGGRLQTISLIRISNITEDNQEIQINITDQIKTSAINREQPTLHIPFFTEKPNLCVATTLKNYIELTSKLRTPDQDFIFLTVRKPHTVANKQTISRWVKQTLSAAGVDTSKFRPHSTRHASTSAALRHGVSLETICRTAGWNTATTFGKFYNRPISDRTSFAKAILNLSTVSN